VAVSTSRPSSCSLALRSVRSGLAPSSALTLIETTLSLTVLAVPVRVGQQVDVSHAQQPRRDGPRRVQAREHAAQADDHLGLGQLGGLAGRGSIGSEASAAFGVAPLGDTPGKGGGAEDAAVNQELMIIRANGKSWLPRPARVGLT